MGISLLIVSVSLLTLNENPKLQGMIAVGASLVYVAGFAVGLGAVVWVVLGEITPMGIRTRAMGLFMSVNYVCNIFVALYSLSIIDFLGTGSHKEKNGLAKMYLIYG